MAKVVEVSYYNCIILKGKSYDSLSDSKYWHIEESRIKGGFNDTSMDFGPKAHLTDPDYRERNAQNTLIYSGLFNERTGVNETNEFSTAQNITKQVDSRYGSVQKLYAEDTNLTIFQEQKISVALINKNAIFSASGGSLTTSSADFIGQIQTYAGDYGIDKNPESFSVYAGRKYFTDKSKGVVLRLSRDGITEISNYGMRSYFRDNLLDATEIHTSWDAHNKSLVLTAKRPSNSFTVDFDEAINGWTSFYSYIPQGFSGSLDSSFFTFKNNDIYKHYVNNNRNSFYGEASEDSYIDMLLNEQPSASKNFNTINYEGTNSWNITNIETDTDTALDIAEFSPANQDLIVSAFKKIHNKYYSNIFNNTTESENEVVFGEDVSGIKGFFAKMKIQTSSTDYKELFSVSTNYNINSY